MIKLTIHNKEKIKTIIMEHSHVDLEKAQSISEDIFKLLHGNTEELYYRIVYAMHLNNNTQFDKQIFQTMFEVYNYLLSVMDNQEKKEELKEIYIKFFDQIFIQSMKITEKIQKRAERLESALKHITVQHDKMLNTQRLMIGNISHEMRTSLNAIKGYITLITKEELLKGESKVHLEKAEIATSSLEALVSDILDITKINSDQMEIKNTPFWLDEVVLNSINNVDLLMQKKQLEFKHNVSFFLHQVIGDKQRLTEILSNLLSNAVKYTNHGFIHLSIDEHPLSKNKIEVRFRIEDSGMGMSKEEIDNIFDSYTRHAHDVQGLGLGLFISKKLAQKMNGDITVESKKGQGSIFTLTLPFNQKTDMTFGMEEKIIYFFNDTKDPEQRRSFDQKVKLLKSLGAKVESFEDEKYFTQFLLEHKDHHKHQPHIISITTSKQNLIQFNALLNYLKNFSAYDYTYFIAEQTGAKTSLDFFDKSFERFSTLSSYMDAIQRYNKQRSTQKEKHQMRILAVDDIETNLDILELFLHQKYPHIIIDKASGGYEAVGMYKVNNYDLIFVDLKMPGLSGFDVIKKFENLKSLPLTYALTADVYKDTYDKVKQSGFTGLLEKPLKLDQLYKIIEDIIHVSNH